MNECPQSDCLVGLPAEDFPALPRFDTVSFTEVDATLLLEIERTFLSRPCRRAPNLQLLQLGCMMAVQQQS